MDYVGQLLWEMDGPLRAAFAGVVAVAPSVLFVLFYRSLLRLRDGQLVQRVAEQTDATPVGLNDVGSGLVSEERAKLPENDREGALVECPGCGTANVDHATVCRECMEEL